MLPLRMARAPGFLVGMALVGYISAVVDGFACPPAQVARRTKSSGLMRSTHLTMGMTKEQSLLLTRRIVLAASLSAKFGVTNTGAHCLTQACLEALPDPFVDVTSSVKGGSGATCEDDDGSNKTSQYSEDTPESFRPRTKIARQPPEDDEPEYGNHKKNYQYQPEDFFPQNKMGRQPHEDDEPEPEHRADNPF